MGAAKKAEGYNGWSNYETWAVALWIDNEEPSYRYWREAAAWAKQRGSKQTAVIALANRLKDELSEQAPDLGASMWADLLNAALGEVDWDEIAQNMIEE